jgi:hypothetical protein
MGSQSHRVGSGCLQLSVFGQIKVGAALCVHILAFAMASYSHDNHRFGIDAILQSAYGNFTNCLWHCSSAYRSCTCKYSFSALVPSCGRAFTPPLGNTSKTQQWTFGSIFFMDIRYHEAYFELYRLQLLSYYRNIRFIRLISNSGCLL